MPPQPGPPVYPQQPASANYPQQTAYPNSPQQVAPGPQSSGPMPPTGPPSYPSGQPVYPGYPQQAPPVYAPQPYGNAPVAPGSAPPAYPSYSPLPSYTPLSGGTPYAGAPVYGQGYPAQMQRTLNQCKVCGSMLAYGMLSCAVCQVPLGMIANPYDPTVTTYLDARALNQPGTSPVYAAPGAYAGRAVNPANNVPAEVKGGWNWSAALNSTLWSFTHRAAGWGLFCAAGLFLWVVMIIGISSLSPAERHNSGSDSGSILGGVIFVGGTALFWIIKTFYLGLKGNEIAWRSGRYASVAQLQNAQRQWASWSIVVFLIASVVLFAATYIAGK
jgi:hypothetical protein